jgi:hypothetical protein
VTQLRHQADGACGCRPSSSGKSKTLSCSFASVRVRRAFQSGSGMRTRIHHPDRAALRLCLLLNPELDELLGYTRKVRCDSLYLR